MLEIFSPLKFLWEVLHERAANRIAAYPERIKFFDALREVEGRLTADGVDIDKKTVFAFHPYVERSQFAFGREIHQELDTLYRGLDELVELQRRPNESDAAQARLHECHERILRIKKMMEPFLKQSPL